LKVPNIFFVNYDLIKKSIIFVDVRGRMSGDGSVAGGYPPIWEMA
jgi:hypothetical protein